MVFLKDNATTKLHSYKKNFMEPKFIKQAQQKEIIIQEAASLDSINDH